MKTQDILAGMAENARQIEVLKASQPRYSLGPQAEVAIAMYNLGIERRLDHVDQATMAVEQDDPERGITWRVCSRRWVNEDGSDEYFTPYHVLDAGMAGVEELRTNIEAGAVRAEEIVAERAALAEQMRDEEELVRLLDKFGVELS